MLVLRPILSSVYVRSFAGLCLRDVGVFTRCHLLQVPETGSCRGLFGQVPLLLDASLSAGQYNQYIGLSRPGPLQVRVYGSLILAANCLILGPRYLNFNFRSHALNFRSQILNFRSQVLNFRSLDPKSSSSIGPRSRSLF